MKNLFLFFSLFFGYFMAIAQTEKGSVFLSGQLNISSHSIENNNTTSKSNNFSFRPSTGLFISDNWLLGVQTNLSSSRIKDSFNSGREIQSQSNRVLIGPFVRRYFPIEEKLAFFGGLNAAYGNSRSKRDQNTAGVLELFSKGRNFFTHIDVGLTYFPKKWLGIELSAQPLSYVYQIEESVQNNSSTNSNIFSFDLNTSSIFLGINFFLNKK